MLFETILFKDTLPQHPSYHEKRMQRSVGKSFSISTLRAPDSALYRCRIVYESEILSVSFERYKKREINSLRLVYSDITYEKKWVDRRELDALFLQRDGCDDVVIVKDGLITDTSIANLAFLNDEGVWVTPEAPLLCGTTRERLLDSGFLKTEAIKAHEISRFRCVAIMNALRGFEPLGAVEDVFRF